MKRPSRIVLTCMATTGAVTGAAFSISSIAAAATGAAPASPAISTPTPAADQAGLQRQAALLHSRIGRLDQQIAAERRRAALSERKAVAAPVTAPVTSPQAPVAPAVTYSAPQYVAAAPAPTWAPAPAPTSAAPVAAPVVTPPPVHTTTGASGAAAAGHEPTDGESDD